MRHDQRISQEKKIIPIVCPANGPDLNIIENIWSTVYNKLLKFSINTIDELKNALQIVWSDISNDTIRKPFESLPERLRQVINCKSYSCNL